MASFIVNSGVTDTIPKTVSNNDIGTLEAGGTLTAATAITWTGGSNAPGVVIDNSGSVNGGTRAIDSSGAFAAGGSITVNNNAGATISATGNDAWRVNNALNAGGTITLNNAGLMTSAGGQTLDFEAITSVNANIDIHNASTGTIRSTSSDAICPGAGDISIDNSGLIEFDGRARHQSEYHQSRQHHILRADQRRRGNDPGPDRRGADHRRHAEPDRDRHVRHRQRRHDRIHRYRRQQRPGARS